MDASLTRQTFGTTPAGEVVERITLANARGARVRVITYGATITQLEMPDRHGTLGDVVLGCDTLEGYLRQPWYLGAVVGRCASRIARGRFTLGDRTYELAVNNAPNHLHGGVRGFDKVVWSAEPFERGGGVGVTLRHVSPDGDQGYPGTLRAAVTYLLTEDDEVRIAYEATTDASTPVNLTQHTYFNLAGTGDILGHELTVAAERFTPVDASLIPTGEMRPVSGTPFDFRDPHTIGARIGHDDAQLRIGAGYDHTFVVAREGPGLARAAVLRDPASGRTLEVHTTEPGVHLYSGNHLDGSIAGKGGRPLARRSGLCLETQHFTDSPNQPAFPSTILEPGETFRSTTLWRFGADATP